jgi:two-component system, chemotaxis family, protein-glutamate methylesterase/glutaminase
MAKTRVLIIEDSLTVRRQLAEVIAADPELEMLAATGDGRSGIELCQRLRPDVITLDLLLPGMSGLEVTEYIMAYFPTPILIVSAAVNRGELHRTFEALAAGAVDVLDKSNGKDFADSSWAVRLRATVKLVARIKVITHPRLRLRSLGRTRRGPISLPPAPLPARDSGVWRSANGTPEIIVIGTSTGGPRALLDILAPLPQSFPLPFLVVIHLGGTFGGGFAEWLAAQTSVPVRFAEDGEPLPRPGKALILLAPPDRHLIVRRGRLHLTTDPERHSCRPSVDALFESIADECRAGVIACLLTGMGRDGAAGLLRIRERGGHTIAQDEASSVVFGMPREGILLGAAARVLPLAEIGPFLTEIARPLAARARSSP